MTFHPLTQTVQTVSGVSQVSPSGDATGVTDLANINAALTGFPRKKAILAPGTFFISGPMVPQNNTNLQGSGILTTVVQQGSSFAGSQMYTAQGGCTISDLTLKAPSTTTSSNVQADAILITQQGTIIQNVTVRNIQFANINGWCVNFTDLGTFGAPTGMFYDNLRDGLHNSGGLQILGASRTMGIWVNNVNLNANGGTATNLDACYIQDVFDLEFNNFYFGVGGTSTGYGLHLNGHNNNMRFFHTELGSGTADVLIEDGVNGHASNITFIGCTFQTGSGTNVDLEGTCTDVQFNACNFNTAQTHGAVVNTSGNRIKFRGCGWATTGTSTNNGQGATGTNYDLNWSGSGTGTVQDCEFASSIVAALSIGVQKSVNIAASQAVIFDNVKFTGTSASSSNWFSNTPSAVMRTDGGNFNWPAGLAASPATFSPSNPATNTSASLVMAGIGSTCTYTPATTGHVIVSVTGLYRTQTGTANMGIGGRFGTGTAPVNGAAVTGTRFGNGDFSAHGVNTANGNPFAITAAVTLTAGTTYWFDLASSTDNAADAATFTNITVTLMETPT